MWFYGVVAGCGGLGGGQVDLGVYFRSVFQDSILHWKPGGGIWGCTWVG